MADPTKVIHDLFDSFKHTAEYKDSVMMEIMGRRQEFEEHLDKMWQTYTRGNMQQVVEYKKQVQYIKGAGLIVLRSKTTGKHKITYPSENRG
jgi:hypothetical protein